MYGREDWRGCAVSVRRAQGQTEYFPTLSRWEDLGLPLTSADKHGLNQPAILTLPPKHTHKIKVLSNHRSSRSTEVEIEGVFGGSKIMKLVHQQQLA